MRNPQKIFAASIAFIFLLSGAISIRANTEAARSLSAQDSNGVLERGYRTGYSDGYQAGYRDSVDRASRDYRSKEEYRRADRAYSSNYGALEDYRDGYQQGFEAGYGAGYDRRRFDSTVPAGLARRGTVDAQDDDEAAMTQSSSSTTTSQQTTARRDNTTGAVGPIFIPANTVLRVELLTNLSTEATQEGDRFQARVVEPREYEGAMVDGRVTRVKRPGKVKGRAELQLSFNQISMNGRWANFSAQVVEIVDTQGTSTGEVDPEGGVKGGSTTKGDIVKVGTGTAIGAIIGAIAGGGKGAAIGAVIGGAIGTGGVLASRGKDIYLPNGQHLRIRTATDARL